VLFIGTQFSNLYTAVDTISCFASRKSAGRCTSRGLGWRIHESVEDTKLSTNKQHSLSHRERGMTLTPDGSRRILQNQKTGKRPRQEGNPGVIDSSGSRHGAATVKGWKRARQQDHSGERSGDSQDATTFRTRQAGTYSVDPQALSSSLTHARRMDGFSENKKNSVP